MLLRFSFGCDALGKEIYQILMRYQKFISPTNLEMILPPRLITVTQIENHNRASFIKRNLVNIDNTNACFKIKPKECQGLATLKFSISIQTEGSWTTADRAGDSDETMRLWLFILTKQRYMGIFQPMSHFVDLPLAEFLISTTVNVSSLMQWIFDTQRISFKSSFWSY